MPGLFDAMADVEFNKACNKALELGTGLPVVQCGLGIANPMLHVSFNTVGIGPRTFVAAVITDGVEMPDGTKEPVFGNPYKYKLNGYRRKASSDDFEHCTWMANDIDTLIGKVAITKGRNA